MSTFCPPTLPPPCTCPLGDAGRSHGSALVSLVCYLCEPKAPSPGPLPWKPLLRPGRGDASEWQGHLMP